MNIGSRRARDLLIVVAALLLLGPALIYLGSVDPSEVATVEQLVSPTRAREVRRLRALFGADSDLLLVSLSASPAGPSAARLAEVERVIAEVPGVTQVMSSASRPRLTLRGPEPRLVVERGPWPDRPVAALDRLLRPDPSTALFMVTLDAGAATLTAARWMVGSLSRRLDEIRAPAETTRVVGFPAQRVRTWVEARRDVTWTLPLLVFAAVIIPWLFFRSGWAALFSLLLAVLASCATVLCYRVVMGALHPWVLVLIPLVWSIATMDTMHLYECAARRRSAGDPDPVGAAARELALPCFVTALITAVSLLALAAPGGPPLMRVFGVWGAVGTAFAYLLSFVVGGPLLRLGGARPPPSDNPSRLARRLIALSQRRAWLVVLGWASACAASVAVLPRLRAESSYADAFVADHPAARDLAALRGVTGSDLIPIEIYVEATAARRDDPRALLLATVSLDQYLRTLPETRLSLSAASLATELLNAEPRARTLLRDLRDPAEVRARVTSLGADARLAPWTNLPHGATRTLLLLAPTTVARKTEILAWIDHFGRTMLDGCHVDFGGVGTLYHAAETGAWTGLGWGMGGDLVLLVVALAVVLRRPRAVAAGLLGNVVPVIVLGGVMVAAGIPWSLGLLGLPVIVLGLAADDTVHLLWPLRRAGRPVATALALAYRRFGSAALATSVLIAVCLASLLVSDFRASRALGWLFPTGILLALLAELTLVPALLVIGRFNARVRPGRSETSG